MKIAYVASIRFPTEKAHGYQIARVLEALARMGHEVSLIVPKRKNTVSTTWHEYYEVEPLFGVSYLRSVDVYGRGLISSVFFILSTVLFAIRASRRVSGDTVVLTRDTPVAFVCGLIGRRVIYVAHRAHKSALDRFLLSRVVAVVANSVGTKQGMSEALLAPIEVIPNAADANIFAHTEPHNLRGELGLPNGFLALYSGHLYSWKGADKLIDTALALRDRTDMHIAVIGGTAKDITRLTSLRDQHGLSNISFLGHKNRGEVPKYLAAADALLVPNIKEGESTEETSPLKLFEYMAAKRPIVISDLPSLRRILPDNAGFYVPEGDGAAIAFALKYIEEHREEAARRAECSYVEGQKYSWEGHAQKLSGIIASVV